MSTSGNYLKGKEKEFMAIGFGQELVFFVAKVAII
jgi:hypothetical protein